MVGGEKTEKKEKRTVANASSHVPLGVGGEEKRERGKIMLSLGHFRNNHLPKNLKKKKKKKGVTRAARGNIDGGPYT